MKGPELKVALEIISNPDDLVFIIAGEDPFVLRGPGANFRIVALPDDLNMIKGQNPIDLIEYQLSAAVSTVEQELRNGGSFQGLLNPREEPLEDVAILKDRDIKKIIEGLKKDGFHETFNKKQKSI